MGKGYNTSLTKRAKGKTLTMENLDARNKLKEARAELTGDLTEVRLRDEKPNKVIRIGSTLPDKVKMDLLGFLKENEDVFAWTAIDMPGINLRVISHHLNVNPT